MRIDALPTPSLLLDVERLDRNLARMHRRVAELGVAFRPHLKTAKSAEVARRVWGSRTGPITVSTLAEARYFLANGFSDILYAVGLAPQKIDEASALCRQGAQLTVVLDHPATAEALAGRSAGQPVLDVLIEIDADGGRAGLAPASDGLVELARRIAHNPGTRLRGVMSHAGSSYRAGGIEGARRVAETERSAVDQSARRLRAAGLACDVVSVGSTPAALCARTLDGVTELRAGVYMFQDLTMAGVGVCSLDDLAVTVLGTVIGHYPDRGRVIIDAGGLALSKETGPGGSGGQHYGLVADEHGVLFEGLVVERTSQEHGIVGAPGGTLPFKRLPIGARVRVLPNHVCMTAAAHDRYHVIDGEGQVIDAWPRCNGW